MTLEYLTFESSGEAPSSISQGRVNSTKGRWFSWIKKHYRLEWWYFDAVLNKEYSINEGFRIYHLRGIDIPQHCINIYRRGKLLTESKSVKRLTQTAIAREKETIYHP